MIHTEDARLRPIRLQCLKSASLSIPMVTTLIIPVVGNVREPSLRNVITLAPALKRPLQPDWAVERPSIVPQGGRVRRERLRLLATLKGFVNQVTRTHTVDLKSGHTHTVDLKPGHTHIVENAWCGDLRNQLARI